MHHALEVIDGKTYTRPGSDLRRAETRHMLNGFVSTVTSWPGARLDEIPDQYIPVELADELVANRDALRMNYRIVTVGKARMLLGRPVREDA